MEIIQTTALITINETLWVQMIVFIVFLFLINRLMFRRVRRNLKEREAHFEALRRDIEALEKEMKGLLAATEAEERQLRRAAHQMVDTLRQDGQQEAQRLMTKALEDIKLRQHEAEKTLQTVMAAARREVESEAGELTAAIVQRLTQTEALS
jgi:F-type H+-transporting ATPase subunit b